MTSPRLAGPFLLLFLGSGLPVEAQLDLPRRRDAPVGRAPGTGQGLELPSTPGGDLAPRPEGEGPGLTLPAVPVPSLLPPPPLEPGASGDYAPSATGAAAYVLDQLDPVEDPDASLALAAVESLGALGREGLDASRSALWGRGPAGLVAAARVLVRFGGPDERRAVVQRLEAELPGRAAGALLRTALSADPVLVTPELLVRLLHHPTSAMRTAAHHALAGRVEPSLLPVLATQLDADRSHTRLLTLDLVAAVDDPSVRHLLSSRLGDSTGKVAERAAELLAALGDEEVAGLLLERSLGEAPMSRAGAFALLALIGREDRLRRPILLDEHVPPLLAGLASDREIVAGACAAALAGIGFRSTDAGEHRWLDRDVPHTMVRLATGAVFHKDFSALQGPALARLSLISGEAFGRNGPAWQAWWAENASGFHARRAVLAVAPEETARIRVDLRPDLHRSDGWVLVGPGLGEDVEDARAIYLSARQAGELVGTLEAEGILGSERLPARLPDRLLGGRSLEVAVGERVKRIEVPVGASAPWFDAVEEKIEELLEENRWQRFHPEGTSRHGFWLSEHEAWEAETSATVRGRRLKQLVLARLRSVPPHLRDLDLEELARIHAEAGVPEPSDFAHLKELLDDEEYFGGRARTLLDLALAAAATTGTPPRPEGATVEPVLGRELFELVVDRFGETARAEGERVLSAAGREMVRAVARDPDALGRSFAPAGLARRPTAADLELLLALLDDPDPRVEIACVRAVGEEHIAAARDPVLRRARTAPAPVRAEALRAAGRLGGDEVLNACILGLAEKDRDVQHAAARALADLADPESSALLASLFARGPESHFFEPAREGLLALGEAGHSELLRLTTAAAFRTRRGAALLLAEQGVPQAVSPLLQILTEMPDDERVAAELAVLTCVDLRTEEDPVRAWWSWWDLVVHDDALAWLRAAGEREALVAPATEDLSGGGTRTGAEFLLALMRLPRPHVAERARRELVRLLGTSVEPLPGPGIERRRRALEIQAAIDETYGE